MPHSAPPTTSPEMPHDASTLGPQALPPGHSPPPTNPPAPTHSPRPVATAIKAAPKRPEKPRRAPPRVEALTPENQLQQQIDSRLDSLI